MVPIAREIAMTAGELFGLAIMCVLIYFRFREALGVREEAMAEGTKPTALIRDALVADAMSASVPQGL